MSGMTTFAALCEALSNTGIPFAAFAWASDPFPAYPAWGVVAVDSGFQLYGDEHIAEEGFEGTVDLFTTHLGAEDFTAVSAALNAQDLAVRLNSVQYEQDRRLLHYEWVWRSAAPLVTE